MSYLELLTQTATRLRDVLGAEDRYGNPIPSDETEVSYPCLLEPLGGTVNAGSSEVTRGRDTQIEELLLFLPADVDVKGSDRVEIDGTIYELDGPPRSYRHPKTGAHHVEASVRRVAGG